MKSSDSCQLGPGEGRKRPGKAKKVGLKQSME